MTFGPGPSAPPTPAPDQTLTDMPRAAGSYDRRRAGRACIVCRARKTKCDNNRPVCGFCLATGGHCQYAEDEGTDHSKLDRGSLAILQRLAEMEQTLLAAVAVERQSQLTAPAQPVVSFPSNAAVAGATENTNARQGGQPPTAQMIMASAEMAFESISRWPVFGMEPVLPLVSVLARAPIARRCDPEESIYNPDPDLVFQLVENFLLSNHIKNPIFDIDTLWGQVRRFVQSGAQCEDDVVCLVLLICAVSILSVSPTREQQAGYSRQPERLSRAEAFFQASQRRLGMLYHQSSLLAIQCSFLTAVYLMSTFRILAAWKAFSQAGTQELCTELGLSGSSLNEMPYPHVYPSPPGPGILTNLSTNRQGKDDLERSWFFYLAEIALRRIMNDALSSRYKRDSWYYTGDKWWATTTESQGSAGYGYCQYVEEYKQKLEDWYKLLPASVSFTRDPAQPILDVLPGILRSHYIDILDVVYYPAIRAVVCEPLNELSPRLLQIGREALQNAFERITISKYGFWHRHQGTWLMIRTCSRSALYLLGVALRAKYEREREPHPRDGGTSMFAELLPVGGKWRAAVLSVIHLIEYWKEESIDMGDLLARLKHLHDLTE
ncbi:hypothetical protein BJX62DRAFT_236587 [Aspergillus germanicus]